jgi:hypothetical protein
MPGDYLDKESPLLSKSVTVHYSPITPFSGMYREVHMNMYPEGQLLPSH